MRLRDARLLRKCCSSYVGYLTDTPFKPPCQTDFGQSVSSKRLLWTTYRLYSVGRDGQYLGPARAKDAPRAVAPSRPAQTPEPTR